MDKTVAARLADMQGLREAIWRLYYVVMVTPTGSRYRARAYATDGREDFEVRGATPLAVIEAVARHLGIAVPARSAIQPATPAIIANPMTAAMTAHVGMT